MRWWDIDGVMELERDLFGDESWTVAMFWSELSETDTRYYLVAAEGDASSATPACVRTPTSRSCRRSRSPAIDKATASGLSC